MPTRAPVNDEHGCKVVMASIAVVVVDDVVLVAEVVTVDAVSKAVVEKGATFVEVVVASDVQISWPVRSPWK